MDVPRRRRARTRPGHPSRAAATAPQTCYEREGGGVGAMEEELRKGRLAAYRQTRVLTPESWGHSCLSNPKKKAIMAMQAVPGASRQLDYDLVKDLRSCLKLLQLHKIW